jgi:hypothetical protein
LNFLVWSIVACEIAFWVVICLGLVVRYVLRKKMLSLVLLSLTPLIDLYLLIVSGIDMYYGATATIAHAVAGIYIGVSIAFGKSMILWADERFRYYVMKKGEKPMKRYGREYAVHYMKGLFRHGIAFAIGAGILYFTHWIVGDVSRTEVLIRTASIWMLVLGIDVLISVSNFIWKKEYKSS